MSLQMQINARLISTLSDREDAGTPGVYLVDFAPDVRTHPAPKLASIALDIFHSNVPIGAMDDFEITVIYGGATVAGRDPDHEDYSGSNDGSIEKISDHPM